MSIIMKKVRWKNFLSTGNNYSEIILNKHKTTSISGENGSGKTTMLDAIVFALFGRPYRNINIPQLVNSINKKDCIVELYFDIGKKPYIVRRGISPKVFEIYQDGKLIDQDSTTKDYQKMFEDQILKMSFKSFCQVVILGSTNYIPFMRLTAAERRSVVENLLDINVFSTMNSVLKGNMSILKDSLINTNNKMEILREKTELQKNHIDILKKKQDKHHEDQIAKKKELMLQREELKEKIEKTEQKISELTAKTSKKQEVEKELNSLFSELMILEKTVTKNNKEIKFIEDATTCHFCTQTINEQTKNKLISDKNNEIKHTCLQSDQIERKVNMLKKQIDEINKISKECLELSNECNELNSSCKAINKLILSLENEINSNAIDKTDIETAQAKMGDFIKEGKLLVDEKQKILDDTHYANIAYVLLKDSGIKSKIIKHYLPIMNKVINKYLSEMNFFVQFELDEEFKESIKSRNRDIFSYENFSEGEKRKIDLALLFAWRKISQVKNSLSCNLLIFDEILDGSLDDSATKLLLNILQIMDKNSNIFVISHKSKDILQDKFEHNIMFTKKKNFSKAIHE